MSAPCPTQAGSTAVHDSKVYCRPANQGDIFELYLEQRRWRQLEKCPSSSCMLVNIDNVLTAVGGKNSKKLWSYVKISEGGAWAELYPEMRVERYNAAVVYSKKSLIVAGGFLKAWSCTPAVEVLDVTSRIWFTTQPLPYSIYSASAAISNGCVYVVGGYFEKSRGHFSVLSCPLSSLTEGLVTAESFPTSSSSSSSSLLSLQQACGGSDGSNYAATGVATTSITTTTTTTAGATPANNSISSSSNSTSSLPSLATPAAVWRRTADLPVCRSTCFNFRGKLAVVGGRMVNGCDSGTMYIYSPSKNSWEPLTEIAQPRSECHVAVLRDRKVVVVGGCHGNDMALMDSVEVGEIRSFSLS